MRPAAEDRPPVQRPPFRSSALRIPDAAPSLLALLAFFLSLVVLMLRLGAAPPQTLHAWISSDTLYPVDVTIDTLKDGFPLSGWRFSIAPCWFPDLFACGFFWIVTRSAVLATLFAGFIQLPLIVWAFDLARRAIGIKAPLQTVFLLGVSVAITLDVAARPGLTYPDFYRFFEPQSHVGSLVMSLFALALALLILSRKLAAAPSTRRLNIGYFVLCLLAGMSNLMFFPQILVPLTAALVLAAFLGVLASGDVWQPMALGWPAAILGAILNRILFHTTAVSAESTISPGRALTCLDVFARGFVAQILSGQFLHLLAVLWLFVCLGAVLGFLRIFIRRTSPVGAETRLMFVFFLSWFLSALASVGAIIVGGSNGLAEFRDYIWSTHYLQSLFFIPLFGLPLTLAWLLDRLPRPSLARPPALALALLCLIAPVQALVHAPSPPVSISRYQPPLVRFLDQLAAKDGLRYGFAGYWQARVITLLSSSGLRVYPIDGSLRPLLWVSNVYWYSQQLNDRKKPPPVDFVLLDDPLWKISRESVVAALGAPADELNFQGTRILVYRKLPR